MADFRPVPETDRETVERTLQYAFSPDSGPIVEESDDDWPPTLYDQRGVYDGGELRSVCRLYTIPARVRGTETSVGGLGAVATPPEHRRRGYVRELCHGALDEYDSNGVGLVALWPFSTPFYEQFGWATAYNYTRIEAPPETLPSHDPAGQIRRLDADDWDRLQSADARHSAEATLSIRRTEQWWREQTFSSGGGGGDPPYCYGYERDGDLVGYLLYVVDDDDQHTLVVDNFTFADEEARLALLDFLAGHGAQIEQVVVRTEPNGEFLARVADPADIDCEVKTGPMLRLTSVEWLETLDWPAVELDCTLSVADPLRDRTDGRYRLSVADGAASVDRLGERESGTGDESKSDGKNDDIVVDIGTLSQLVVGTHDIETAERVASLDVRTESVREPLAELFETGPVHVRQFF